MPVTTRSALLAHQDLPRAVSVFKLGLQVNCRFCLFFCSQNSKRVITQLIWVFREFVSVLRSNLEEGRNVDTISARAIYHELEQMKLCDTGAVLYQFFFSGFNFTAAEIVYNCDDQSYFHIFLRNSNILSFTFSIVFFTIDGYITKSQCVQLPVGLVTELVEQCKGIAKEALQRS